MMRIRKSKANSNTRTNGGFSVVELLVTGVVLSVVTSAGVMGINRARASVRLAGAAREYGAYIEKARVHSIRSHADDESERASVAINDDMTSYTVTIDLDGDGVLDTKTITLPDGVEFKTVETIAFDWRGRTWNTVGTTTEANKQVSITLKDSYEDKVSIDVTGSGDITINSDVFEDELPDVNLKVGDLASGPTSTPTPVEEIPTPTPTPESVPTPDNTGNPDPTPLPTPDLGDIIPVPTPTPRGKPTPDATPEPTPDAVPTPTPAPTVCLLSVDLPELRLTKDGLATIKVNHNAGATLTVTGTSSKPSDLQVSPAAQVVASGGSASFTIKSKRTIGLYTVTFSTSCGSKTVSVLVVSLF
jgi:Tfp pilus assembly protein FimT